MNGIRIVRYALWATVLVLLVALGAVYYLRETGDGPLTASAIRGGPFSLVDQHGNTVTEASLKGHPSAMFFGYTFCPDICPTTLTLMKAVMDDLGPDAQKVQMLLLSIDPERDTPEQLASYVTSFHPRLVGLSGSPEQIAAALKSYRVYAKKTEDPKSSAGFTYDHTSIIYLMDRNGDYLGNFTHATSVDRIAERMAKLP